MPRTRTPTRDDIGAVLRALRTRAGLSQERLEHSTRLHRTYVSSVERGERNPSFEAIARWLNGVGATWGEFGAEMDRQLRHR